MTPAAWFALDGRAAIVTGGGSGIGRACALALAGAGAAVLVVGRRQVKLDTVCAEVRAAGGVCEAFAADLTEEEGCRAMVEACRGHFGRVDILVNSAGSRGASGELEAELTAENLRATMAADFDATFFAVKHAWPGRGPLSTLPRWRRCRPAARSYTPPLKAPCAASRARWPNAWAPTGCASTPSTPASW